MQPNVAPRVPLVSVTEAAARRGDGSGALLVDVRERDELVQIRPTDAFLIPMSELNARLDELPTDRTLMFICHSGARSGRVAAFLLQQGYEDVANVEGGMLAWNAARLPTRHGPIDPAEEILPAAP